MFQRNQRVLIREKMEDAMVVAEIRDVRGCYGVVCLTLKME